MSRSNTALPGSRRRFLLSLGGIALGATPLGCKQTPELPRYGDIGQFTLADQDGRPFSRSQLDGKVWVATFFFTRCPVVCPKLMKTMRSLQVAAQEQKLEARFVSFSVDPENDSAPVLKKYAARFSADLSNWSLLTGDYETVKRTAVQGFKQALEGKPDPAKGDHFGVIHGSRLLLVDKHGQLRGFYRANDADVIERLASDMRALGA